MCTPHWLTRKEGFFCLFLFLSMCVESKCRQSDDCVNAGVCQQPPNELIRGPWESRSECKKELAMGCFPKVIPAAKAFCRGLVPLHPSGWAPGLVSTRSSPGRCLKAQACT